MLAGIERDGIVGGEATLVKLGRLTVDVLDFQARGHSETSISRNGSRLFAPSEPKLPQICYPSVNRIEAWKHALPWAAALRSRPPLACSRPPLACSRSPRTAAQDEVRARTDRSLLDKRINLDECSA